MTNIETNKLSNEFERQLYLLNSYIYERILFFEQHELVNKNDNMKSYCMFDITKLHYNNNDEYSFSYNFIERAVKLLMEDINDKKADKEEHVKEYIMSLVCNHLETLGVSFEVIDNSLIKVDITRRINEYHTLVKRK